MTPLQEERIALAWDELGKMATAKQIFNFLQKKYKYPGFKSKYAVAQAVRVIKARRNQF